MTVDCFGWFFLFTLVIGPAICVVLLILGIGMNSIEEKIRAFAKTLVEEVQLSNDSLWKRRFDDLSEQLKFLKDHAQTLYDDNKKHGLTVNTIESEGFLRAATSAYMMVDSTLSAISDED